MSRLGTGRWNLLHILSLSYCVVSLHRVRCREEGAGHEGVDNVESEDGESSSHNTSVYSISIPNARDTERHRSIECHLYLNHSQYGRKMTVAVGFVAYSALAIGSCWIPNLSALLLSRFLMGAVHPTIQKTGYILGMEVADPKWRTHIGIVLFLPWALGLMAWGGFAYLVREWRMLQLTVSLLCLAFLPTLWFMDESPRWLAVRGQHRRALRVLQRAARWNGSPSPRGRASALLKDGVKDEVRARACAHV
nr:solute carrier family 22 member 2-like [Penaeus vannamei]